MDWIMAIAWALHDVAGIAVAALVLCAIVAGAVLYLTPFEER